MRRPMSSMSAAGWAATVLLLGCLPACGGSGGPTRPGGPVFGIVGSSLARLAVIGYNELGGTRAWSNQAVAEYGGGHIIAWMAEIGAPESRFWGRFEAALTAEPGTDRIWWQIAVRGRNDPPPVVLLPSDREAVRAVALEIGRIAGSTRPIFVSPMPEYDPASLCSRPGSAGVEIARLMAEYAVDEGLATAGPLMPPITPENNNGPGDPCHQGPVGRRQHGEALRDFFGA